MQVFKVSTAARMRVVKYVCQQFIVIVAGGKGNEEDTGASLAGGQVFTKLDLSHAYQKVVLDEESKGYVTINTQKGLSLPCQQATIRSIICTFDVSANHGRCPT